MANFIFLGVTTLFVVKLLWNVFIPLIAECKFHRDVRRNLGEEPQPKSISMMIGLEILLLLVMIALAAVYPVRLGEWTIHAGWLAVSGTLAIGGSYLLVTLLGRAARRLLTETKS